MFIFIMNLLMNRLHPEAIALIGLKRDYYTQGNMNFMLVNFYYDYSFHAFGRLLSKWVGRYWNIHNLILMLLIGFRHII